MVLVRDASQDTALVRSRSCFQEVFWARQINTPIGFWPGEGINEVGAIFAFPEPPRRGTPRGTPPRLPQDFPGDTLGTPRKPQRGSPRDPRGTPSDHPRGHHRRQYRTLCGVCFAQRVIDKMICGGGIRPPTRITEGGGLRQSQS